MRGGRALRWLASLIMSTQAQMLEKSFKSFTGDLVGQVADLKTLVTLLGTRELATVSHLRRLPWLTANTPRLRVASSCGIHRCAGQHCGPGSAGVCYS